MTRELKSGLVALVVGLAVLLAVAQVSPWQIHPLALLAAVTCFAVLLAGPALAHTGHLPPARYTAWCWAVAAASGGIYLLGVNPWASIIGDNILYMRDALELAAGKPLGRINFGLGITGLLIPAMTLFQDPVAAAKATVALAAVLLPAGTFLVLRRYARPELALTAAALTAVVPVTVDYAAEVMADVPHAAFDLVALWAVLRYLDRSEHSWERLAVASLAMGWAYHIKSAALVLTMAASLCLVLRGEWRRALWLVFAVLIWVVPWVALEHWQAGKAGYVTSLTDQIGRGEHIPDERVGGFWQNLLYFIAVKNPKDYLTNLGELFVGSGTVVESGLVLLLLVAGAVTGRRCEGQGLLAWLRIPEIHDWYTLGYLAMLFTLPGSPSRYLIPVLPFLILYLLRGAAWVGGLTRSEGVRRAAAPVLGLILVLVCFRADMDLIAFRRAQNGYPGPWGNYYQAALWIKDHTPPGSWVAARKPTLVWFWSRRESELYPWTRDTEAGWATLQSRFDYILLDNLPFFPETQKYLIPILNAHRDRLEVVYATPPPQNFVLRIRKD